GLDEIDQFSLVVGETEEVVLFGDGLGGLAVGTKDAGRAVDEHLLTDGILPDISAQVDGVMVDQVLEELLDSLSVAGLGRADVVVVGYAHAVPERLEG